jgi:NAD(P)-dependent dehydrogenase (short-subunit alcohol dehydrogenase family)
MLVDSWSQVGRVVVVRFLAYAALVLLLTSDRRPVAWMPVAGTRSLVTLGLDELRHCGAGSLQMHRTLTAVVADLVEVAGERAAADGLLEQERLLVSRRDALPVVERCTSSPAVRPLRPPASPPPSGGTTRGRRGWRSRRTAMSERVVVVTGASAGVGRAVARAFGGRGDKVGLIARGVVGLEAAAAEVRAEGGTALVLPTDVAHYDQVESAAARAEAELGPIDVWVNVAFSAVFAPFTQVSMDEYRRTTEVSYLGYVHGTKAALDRMLPRDRGTIVQVGSALAYRGIPLQTAYCGAKHAIQGFNEALRCELLHDGSHVRTTMVQLPAVNTPQFDWVLSRLPRHPQPVPPIYQPEVIARGILYAADHPERREHYIGASTAATILGDKVASGLLDRNLARTGYRSQQTAQPVSPDRPANLWEPADGDGGHDFGAHGSFDAQASGWSLQQRLTHAPWPIAATVNAVAAVVQGVRMVRQNRRAFLEAAESGLRA